MSSDATTVTLKKVSGGQVLKVPLSELSGADQDFVKQKQLEEDNAKKFQAAVSGDIVWRLPGWRSLSWTSEQDAELWLWDEIARAPSVKVASVRVRYSQDRTQFTGRFRTEGSVELRTDRKVVVKATFQATVNGESKDQDQTSEPMTLPTAKSPGKIDLHTVRFSLLK